MRVLSLVPSATETLLSLGVRPVACTRFCEQPGIPAVGGTKNPDIAHIVELAPDLVVMNDEENRHDDFMALRAAGLRVHSMSPRSLDDVGSAVTALADAIGVRVPPPFGASEWGAWLDRHRVGAPHGRALTLVWRRPWMALADDTYGASVLRALGYGNAVEGVEARYPEVVLADFAGSGLDVVLLPSEPYAFKPQHRAEVLSALPGVDVRLVDGQDLFWWGTRTPDAFSRLRAALSS